MGTLKGVELQVRYFVIHCQLYFWIKQHNLLVESRENAHSAAAEEGWSNRMAWQLAVAE